jgi:MoxR-like ATPase
MARDVPIAPNVLDYASRLVLNTHPGREGVPSVSNDYIRYGSSPRGAQALILAAKIHALLSGRLSVAFEDVRRVAPPALRHRLVLSYEAEASGVSPDAVIRELLASVPEEA